MYKTTDRKSVTIVPKREEIEAYILSKPIKFRYEIINGKLSEHTIIYDKEKDPNIYHVKTIKRDSDGKITYFRSNYVYFRKCKGCNCLFSTADRRQFFHSKNCQTQSYYNIQVSSERKDRTCASCGKSLRGRNKGAKTCSNACRMALSRNREII